MNSRAVRATHFLSRAQGNKASQPPVREDNELSVQRRREAKQRERDALETSEAPALDPMAQQNLSDLRVPEIPPAVTTNPVLSLGYHNLVSTIATKES